MVNDMNIFFFSNTFSGDSFGGMESHKYAFIKFFSNSNNLYKCSFDNGYTIDGESFACFEKFLCALNNKSKEEDIYFFNDFYWIEKIPILVQNVKNGLKIIRSGGNDIFRAHIFSDDIPLYIRQKAIVDIINENIDILIVNSNYSFYRNI